VYIRNGPEYADLRDIACGVIFLGTPHSGSGVALIGATLANIAKVTFRRPATQLLQALQLNSSPLLDLTNSFKPIHDQLGLVSFCEQLPMTAGTILPMNIGVVVDQTSATLGVSNERVIPVNSNHTTICKFTGVGDEVYKLVLSQIQRLVEEAVISAAPVPLVYPIQIPDNQDVSSTAQAIQFASNGLILTSEVGRANDYSSPFNDWTELEDAKSSTHIDRMTRIEVSHGDVVDGIRVTYKLNNGTDIVKTHGGTWRLAPVILTASEVLSEVLGRHGDTGNGWGIEIQEISFVILDKRKGSSRVCGPWGNGRARSVNMACGEPFQVSGEILAFAGGCDHDANHNSPRIKALSFIQRS